MTVTTDRDLREALDEFRSYLSDEIAPMMVLESMERLLTSPPQCVATEIQNWIGSQAHTPGQPIVAADYLHHAIKKIYLVAEFDLIDIEKMRGYIEELGRLVIAVCPEADRRSLIDNLNRIGEGESGVVSQVRVLHGRSTAVVQSGEAQVAAPPSAVAPLANSPAPPSPLTSPPPAMPTPSSGATEDGSAPSADVMRGLRRFTALVDRLEQVDPSADQDNESREQVLTQALASAAFSAQSEQELSDHMQRLVELGLDPRVDQIFRQLGSILPGWAAPTTTGEESSESQAPGSRPVEAMHRLVTMAPTAAESGNRFNELVASAVEQFNEGKLAQARTMFELASRLVVEKSVDEDTAAAVQRQAHANLSQNYLRRFSDSTDSRPLLKIILNFFPALSPLSLLDQLYEEPKRDRRKLLLALLETHGADGRNAAYERLVQWADGKQKDPHGYYLRNLVFLLRRIPRPADCDHDGEMTHLVQIADWGQPILQVREVIVAAAQFDKDQAEEFLITKLTELETALIEDACEPYSVDDVANLLERTISSSIRCGSPSALRSVVEHGFRVEPQLGDTHARMRELGTQNLAGDGSLVSRLLDSLESYLPMKVLGFVMQRQNEKISQLIHALSGTPTPEVKELFEEIVERFPEQDFERDATKALAAFGVEAKTDEEMAASLTGDIELFGLPSLLQTMSDTKVTGALSLTDRDANPIARLLFDQGLLVHCMVGRLRGEIAFFQIFENPAPGNFTFKRQRELGSSNDATHEPFEVLPAILEAMRRYDEFQQARVLVPDDARYRWSGDKPSRPHDEPDPAFTKSVWVMAAKGATPMECETALESDSYRVRRLFAHWVESGAIHPV